MTNNDNNSSSNHYVDVVKEHFKHSVEYGKDLMSTFHEVNTDITKKVTDACATNLSLGKSFLECKGVHDVVDWCHSFVNTNVNHAISGASHVFSKTCDKVSKANGDIAKKVSQNIANAKDKFTS